jgi:predicted metal-dependent hydrolase
MLEEVKDEYRMSLGEDAGDVAIAWAPAPRVVLPRRSIKLGSYSADTQIIRIHPALDQPEVPTYFIRWVIFHELLHHRFRADLKARTGRIHTPEFCRLEQSFSAYRSALSWERQHLDLLLWWCPLPDPQRLRMI